MSKLIFCLLSARIACLLTTLLLAGCNDGGKKTVSARLSVIGASYGCDWFSGHCWLRIETAESIERAVDIVLDTQHDVNSVVVRSGKITASHIAKLRKLASLNELDLSGTSVVGELDKVTLPDVLNFHVPLAGESDLLRAFPNVISIAVDIECVDPEFVELLNDRPSVTT